MSSRQAVYRLTVVLVLVSLLRPLTMGGLVLMHQHCDDDVHVHVSDHQSLEDWRRDHARSHPCEGEGDGEDHHQDTIGHDGVCGHDDPIVILAAVDPATRDRVGVTRTVAVQSVSSVVTLPATTPPSGIAHRARSPGRLRLDIGAQSAIAAILLRNHALLL